MAQAKKLGVTGSILVFLSTLFPSIFPSLIHSVVPIAIASIGTVLILIAVKYISSALADESIFNNMLISGILTVSIAIAGYALWVATIIRSVLPQSIASVSLSQAWILIAGIVLFISAIFLKRSYDTIGHKLNVNKYNIAALLNLIYALLFIVMSIGASQQQSVLSLLAGLALFVIPYGVVILEATAFYSISEEA